MSAPLTYKHGAPKAPYSLVPMASGAPFQRNPTTSDLKDPKVGGFYKIGTIWPNAATGAVYVLGSITGGTTANWLGITDAATGNVVGPASATDNALARFDGTTGKIIQNSAVTVADTTGVMTFAAGGGTVYTASGAAARKGASAFVAGVSPAIATTSVTATSVICITRLTLSGAAAATGHYVTITPGVSFTVTSGDVADTSTFEWAIVA